MTKEADGLPFDSRETVPGSGYLILFRAPTELKPFASARDLLLITPHTFISSDRPQFGVGLHVQKQGVEGMGGYTGEFDEDLNEFLPSWRAMKLLSQLQSLDLDFPNAALRFIKGLYGFDYDPENRFINYYELSGEIMPEIDRLFEALGGEVRGEVVFREVMASEPSEEELRKAKELAGRHGIIFPPIVQ